MIRFKRRHNRRIMKLKWVSSQLDNTKPHARAGDWIVMEMRDNKPSPRAFCLSARCFGGARYWKSINKEAAFACMKQSRGSASHGAHAVWKTFLFLFPAFLLVRDKQKWRSKVVDVIFHHRIVFREERKWRRKNPRAPLGKRRKKAISIVFAQNSPRSGSKEQRGPSSSTLFIPFPKTSSSYPL